ncbi:MAG: sensor histidine kinase [Hydrogenophaga sp.]|uniref:sensor histidine kinase n=1 Tax=Hydrogenophaga sp. TaxID=1904254 RepID=UPI00260A0B18|nr:sensor histidine kinase [Hydrogenophaga sp.]MDM7942787.1 sensor histidine kinase [Hydrogenophaga sp.]
MAIQGRGAWHGWFIRAALWALMTGATHAQALSLSDADTQDLAPALTFLEVEDANLSAREIRSPDQARRFQPLPHGTDIPGFGYRNATLWLKAALDVSTQTPVHRVLQVANPQLDRIEVFVFSPDGHLQQALGGDHVPFARRVMPHRHHVFPVTFAQTGTHTVLLRIDSTSSMKVPVSLLKPQALMSQDHRAYSLLSLYFGLMAGLFAYNLLLFAAIRDPVYLYYISYVAAMALAQLALTGLGAQFFWSEQARWDHFVPRLAQAASAFTAVLFARHFLHSQTELPRLDRVLRFLQFGWLLYLALLPWMPFGFSLKVMIALVMTTTVPLVLAGLDRLCARRTGARYFLLAWALLMAGAVTESLVALGWMPVPGWLTHPVMVGSALEMLLLSFALADRIKEERQARERAVSMGMRELVKKEEAERVSHEKSRFLAAVSHDLRQPLFALSLAAESLHAQEPAREPLFQQMRSSLESANGLLDSIMTMARLESGSLRASKTDFFVQPLLDRIDLTFRSQALSKGLRWDVTPSLACVNSDPILLERMVINLVSNAVRFTQSGGVLVSSRVRGSSLLLQVWDTGPGIDPVHHENIFSEYFRGEPETERDNGVGLGLAIVKTCADLLAVRVTMRSVPGRGSCFSLLVPLARSRSDRSDRSGDPQDAPEKSTTEASV